MSMSRGPDGKMQRYTSESQSTNAGGERISQTKQAYSNNAGLDKVGWERTIGDRGTKVVKERTRGSHEETTTKMFTGMDPDNESDFNQQWKQHGGRKALNNFSRRTSNDMRSIMGGEGRRGRNDFNNNNNNNNRMLNNDDGNSRSRRLNGNNNEERNLARGRFLSNSSSRSSSSRNSGY